MDVNQSSSIERQIKSSIKTNKNHYTALVFFGISNNNHTQIKIFSSYGNENKLRLHLTPTTPAEESYYIKPSYDNEARKNNM